MSLRAIRLAKLLLEQRFHGRASLLSEKLVLRFDLSLTPAEAPVATRFALQCLLGDTLAALWESVLSLVLAVTIPCVGVCVKGGKGRI